MAEDESLDSEFKIDKEFLFMDESLYSNKEVSMPIGYFSIISNPDKW